MRIVEKAEVFEKLTMEKCIEVMRGAFIKLESGKCVQPPRTIHALDGVNMFGFMPAYLGKGDYFGAKVINACSANIGTKYPSHVGYVIIFEAEHGTVAGMVEAGSITQIRTGAVSAVATDLLARADADKLAIIGAGAQGRSHLEACMCVRNIKEVSVYDISDEAAQRYAAEMTDKFGIPLKVTASVQEAVKDADIICTVTPSKEPYLKPEWIKEGAHINAVGTFTPATREVTSQLVKASRLYSDYTDAMKKESGEYLIPLSEGLIDESHIKGSIGELLLQKAEGRTNDKEITLFAALGLAVEDVAAAAYVLNS